MTALLTLLGLTAFAYLASFLLSSSRRQGYGLVSGAEFLAIGLGLGPAGLDFLTADLVDAAGPALALAVGWLGFRLGIRIRPGELQAAPARTWAAGLAEPLASGAILFVVLDGADAFLGLGLPPLATAALAVLGSATTKSGALWAIGRFHADGPVTRLLGTATRLNDLPGVLGLGLLFALALAGKSAGGAAPGTRLLATLAGGPALALLAVLLLGRGRFRPDLAWVALLGFTALGTGLSLRLGVSTLAVLALFGAALGLSSRHAGALERMTAETERPLMQVLLLLLGAQLALDPHWMAVGLLFATLRMSAKVAGGQLLRLAPGGARSPWLGAGLFHCGGVAAAMAIAWAAAFPESGQAALWAFTASSLAGDLIGSRSLKLLLKQSGELPDPAPASAKEAA